MKVVSIVFFGFVLMLTGCNFEATAGKTKIITGDKTYNCVDLNKGLFTDSKSNLYKLGYDISNKELHFYLINVKNEKNR